MDFMKEMLKNLTSKDVDESVDSVKTGEKSLTGAINREEVEK